MIYRNSFFQRCPLTNCYDENHWHRWTDNDWRREIKQQRTKIIEESHIHQSHIKGFRVPHLQIDENKHLELIRNFHFHYDSSMLFKSSNLIWPFTLNYYTFNKTDCINCNDSNKIIQALWQFPMHEWIYLDGDVIYNFCNKYLIKMLKGENNDY